MIERSSRSVAPIADATASPTVLPPAPSSRAMLTITEESPALRSTRLPSWLRLELRFDGRPHAACLVVPGLGEQPQYSAGQAPDPAPVIVENVRFDNTLGDRDRVLAQRLRDDDVERNGEHPRRLVAVDGERTGRDHRDERGHVE